MKYISTRDQNQTVTPSQAIVAGISPDGGLYLPESIAQISPDVQKSMLEMDYPNRAAEVLSRFLTDFSREELLQYAQAAYSKAKFPSPAVAPVVKVRKTLSVLELFRGPTCAFKDFALQLLPYLLTASLRKNGETREVLILVATSGDTGKAALEGFADVDGTKICVFYPYGGTSNIQRLQMTTQRGLNVMVSAVHGNFDDAQTGVKQIFTDEKYRSLLAEKGYLLSSANSINWERLAPQIAYYYSAYLDMVRQGTIRLGEPINVAVPTGNFGNILAAYYAKLSGLPIARLICASNRNNVLTDFIRTGTYDKNRPFYLTSSPSMDILVSSNLERLLYLLSGSDAEVRRCMDALKNAGRYQISEEVLAKLNADFDCGFADDDQASETIARTYRETGYLPDTHTAVGIRVYEEYRQRTGDDTPSIVAATASPFKFCPSVLNALGFPVPEGDFDRINTLSVKTGLAAPRSLTALCGMPERFPGVVNPDQMRNVIDSML